MDESIRMTNVVVYASSGIGRSVAALFAREGADVTIVYLPDEEQDAKDTKKLVEKEGRRCLLVAGDLMDDDTCRKAVESHMKEYGALDTLVNNAAKQFMCDDISKIDLEQVESVFRSNILAIFAVTKYSVPYMRKGSSYV